MRPIPAVFFSQGFKNQNLSAQLYLPKAGRTSSVNVKFPLVPKKGPNINSLSQLRNSVSKKV